MVDNADKELARHRVYIANVHWKFAETYAKTSPHWYTVSDWNPDKRESFEAFAVYIREHGYIQMYYSTPFTCLDLDDYYYWTMGAPIDQTVVINRAPIADKKEYR